jgi:hypothetical protein
VRIAEGDLVKDDAKDELAGILAGYRARLSESLAQQAKMKADRASFVELFRSLSGGTIRPVLDDFVALLVKDGHEASILDQQEASARDGSFAPASIALRIVPIPIGAEGNKQSSNAPVEVKFSANQHSMKVLVSSSNNAHGSSGKRGEYDLRELTEDFVVSNVLKTIQEAFGKAH